MGDQERGARGSVDHSVVIVDRFGCRNRQAARGLRAHRQKSLRTRRRSSSSVQKQRKSERAPEAGPTVAKPRVRWRVLLQESTCRWKALRVAKAVHFDGSAGKAALVFRGRRATASPEQDVKRQRSNHTASHAVENAAARQHRPVRCSALPFEVALCVICPKLDRVVKRAST